MIYINDNIRLAISSLRQVCGTNDATGERLGVSGKHISLIIKGEVESIRPSTWEIMEPILRRFMPSHSLSDQTATVNEEPASYCTSNKELSRLFQWLETDACPDQIAAVIATARAVGLPNGSSSSSHSGQAASRFAAGAA